MKRKHVSMAISVLITLALQCISLATGGVKAMVIATIPAAVAGGVLGTLLFPYVKNGSDRL